MSYLPPNPYNNATGAPQLNANPGPTYIHNQQFGQVPSSQLPPGYVGLKQDGNSNSPLPTSAPQNNIVGHVQNNFSHSASSSPAFNHPGMMPPTPVGMPQFRPPMKPLPSGPSNQNTVPTPSSVNPNIVNANSPFPPSFTSQHHINDNAPPLIPSSQHQPLGHGSPMPGVSTPQMNYLPSSNAFRTPPMTNVPPKSVSSGPPYNVQGSTISNPSAPPNPISQPYTTQPISGQPGNSPPFSGPPINGPSGLPTSSGPSINQHSAFPNAPQLMNGPPTGPLVRQPFSMNGPSSGLPAVPPMGPPRPGINGTSIPGPQAIGPQIPQQHGGLHSGPTGLPPRSGQAYQGPPMNGPHASGAPMSGPQSLPTGLHGPPSGPQSVPTGHHMPQQPYPAASNMQNRYPQMPPSNFNQQPMMSQPHGQPPQQYDTKGLSQQMGQLSVTKQGFDQLWGHQMVDLLQSRHIMPEYDEDPPEIKLTHQFADSPNCHPDIFRSTINRIPETNNLLQKSRLPLGILIHPFKDLNHLPVIQCTSIVRCRACRTYINPFVYFVDSKRWKCNLCYRVNDLPEEFQYDPVSKSYGDPSRRPEIKSATIEFIAPGEYMLRPPQPAVYLFLFDVSQIARESGYLQVVCSTLLSNLDELPGDARAQVGFICYDAHVHYYCMSDDLTRPKEMTVLDIDDVFLPSPESLLVNLSERRELVKELLNVLPQRYSNPGSPACALGAALQAAYKLMAPTGGRITVFQTCLPNAGPGALQPREDPNARSSKDVQHLNPATDFYKRIALDCSSAQISVDLFLLSSQYSDLASLSGMSKFSAGTVYHAPLFRAARAWQADALARALTRYLTRKIGFEAVMRVRCTRGISIHTFHGNLFVRSTDLLSLPNVSPDAAFGMQLCIEESLADLQQVCFQAALLYTSSKGERRIRVHTLALPTASTLPDVLHSADQRAIVTLLSKMAVDRCVSASLSEAREALINVAVDALSAFRLAQNLPAGSVSSSLHAPASLRLLPAFILALLKRKAFRVGTSTRLDDRVADMCALKTLPLSAILRRLYPPLYPLCSLPAAPRLSLTAERVNANGAYLLDDDDTMIIYVGHLVSPAFLSEVFGVTAFSQLADEARRLPELRSDGNDELHAFVDKLNDDRPYPSDILVLKDNSPSRHLFTERLVDDRVESAFSYYEFLQHVKDQVK